MAEPVQLGAISAILSGIRTKVDGSVIISLEANPSEIQVINKLMQCHLTGNQLLTVAFVQVVE